MMPMTCFTRKQERIFTNQSGKTIMINPTEAAIGRLFSFVRKKELPKFHSYNFCNL